MGEEERELLLDAFDSNWIALGPHVDALEEELASKVGVSHAVVVSSGTAALHLALLVVGVSEGDEVLCPTLTFAATANAIRYCGAKPVFIDADPVSWNIDPTLLAQQLERMADSGRLPKAVITVDLYGTPCEYDTISKLARDFDVPIVEDAAEALGATYRGGSAGAFGAVGVFSFNGNKVITSGGGGAVVTDDGTMAERVQHLATQARETAPHYQHEEIGYNYRLSNLLAAVARGQLRKLESRVARRRQINARYREQLGDLPGLTVHPSSKGSTCWLTTTLIDPKVASVDRERVRKALVSKGIEARPLWKPMHLQPVFAEHRAVGGQTAAQLFDNGLCLPSGSQLADSQIDEVSHIVRGVVTKSRGMS